MTHTIQINEKKQIRVSERGLGIVVVEHIFKGSTKWHSLIDPAKDGMSFEQIVAELEESQSVPAFTKSHDIMVFQGPA